MPDSDSKVVSLKPPSEVELVEAELKRSADAFTVGLLRTLNSHPPRQQIEMLAVILGHLHAAQKAQAATTDRLLALLERR